MAASLVRGSDGKILALLLPSQVPSEKVSDRVPDGNPVGAGFQYGEEYTQAFVDLNVPFDLETNTAHTDIFDFTEDLFFDASDGTLAITGINGVKGQLLDGTDLEQFDGNTTLSPDWLFSVDVGSDDTVVLQSTSGDLYALGNFAVVGTTVTFDFFSL